MTRGRRLPTSRDGLSFALVVAVVLVAEAVFSVVRIAPESESERLAWHVQAGTAAFLVGVAWILRRRRGVANAILLIASTSLGDSFNGAWLANASLAQFSEPKPGSEPAFWLSALPVVARSAIPAMILALFATEAARGLGRRVVVAVWVLAAFMIAAPIARVLFEASIWPPSADDPWWYPGGGPFMARFDDLTPFLLLGAIAVIASLRDAARRYVPSPSAAGDVATRLFAPSRSLIVGVGAVLLVWLPAALGFLTRPQPPVGEFGIDETARMAWGPVLLALIAFVASRWSRTAAWLAIAAAFQMNAILVLYRAVAEYVVLVPVDAPETRVPLTPIVGALIGAGVLVQLLAFAATGVAFLAATHDGPPPPAAERAWAVRLLGVGIALDAWYLGAAFVATGFPWAYQLTMLPAYPLAAIVIAFGLWRRLVPAVAEAEAVASRPFRPLRYAETVIAEVITGGAEHRRRAVDAERERLLAELGDLRSTLSGLLSDRGLVLEPAAAGGAPWQARARPELRRPSDREIDVIALVATGASNDEIARELVLSLKTVETHLRRLFSRYGVTNRTELAVLAVREGWVDAR